MSSWKDTTFKIQSEFNNNTDRHVYVLATKPFDNFITNTFYVLFIIMSMQKQIRYADRNLLYKSINSVQIKLNLYFL